MEMDISVYANTYRKRTSQRTNRLYTCKCRAQRLYVQLLPKSILIATMYSNRQWDEVFSCHILQDRGLHRLGLLCPFRENSPSTKFVGPYVLLCGHSESVDLLLFVT